MKLDNHSSQSSNESGDGSVRTDEELVLAFQSGDLNVFAEIYLRYYARAEGVCRRYLWNPDDAKEAAQETMLRAFRALPRFNGDFALQAWIERIATNLCFDMMRVAKRRNGNGDGNGHGYSNGQDPLDETMNGHDQVTPDPSEAVEAQMRIEEVREALSRLPEHHRTALVLREIEGRSHEEIGESLGISAPRAKALIHRAKRSFRRIWSESGKALRALIPPFLLPTKLTGLSRVVPGLSELAAPASSGTSATTMAGGERLIATVTIALVAAGAVSIGKGAGPEPTPKTIKAPAVLAVSPSGLEVSGEGVGREPQLGASAESALMEEGGTSGSSSSQNQDEEETSTESDPESAPAADTLAADSESSPGPSPSASESPSSTGSNMVTSAPSWGLRFGSNLSTTYRCGCDPKSTLWSSTYTGEAGKDVRFRQEAIGAVWDAEENPAWKLWIEYWGESTGTTGTLWSRFYLGGGNYGYFASGSLANLTKADDGSFIYTFQGTYALVDGSPASGSTVPHRGSFRAALSWWSDRATLYHAGFSLTEN